MAAPRLYNNRSPAVKRLMKEAAELREPTFMYFAQPLEENLFHWHFTIRGPPDTPFAKGKPKTTEKLTQFYEPL